MSPARSRAVAVLLLGVGALALLLASQQAWWHVRQTIGGTAITRNASGTARAASTGIGLLMLAAVPAVHATRARYRQLLGIVLLLLAFTDLLLIGKRKVSADSVNALLSPHVFETVWPHVAAGASVVCMLGTALVIAYGKRWSEMGRRYDASPQRAVVHDPWTAMEQGIDPTEDQHQD